VTKHLVSVLRLLAALAIILIGSTLQAQSIGIKFNGGMGPGGFFGTDYPPMDPTEVAGVVPQANWNNAAGNIVFNMGPLTDQNGIALNGTSVTWGALYTWTTGIPDAPGDSRLMGGYIDSNEVSFTLVSVQGLSALTTGSYDVYVYSNGDGHGGRRGFFFLGGLGSTVKECQDFGPFDPTAGYAEDKQDGIGGNYLHFTQVTGGTLLLLSTPQNPNDPTDNGFRAPINAIQIVATP
jgi:hypothetical protein